uniref:IP07892p n=1 Tax=Drosophila melanogaster TaxID=7227 RepID=Q4V5Y3_DROME|nr:IP07892p [Drosophila melanogaster]
MAMGSTRSTAIFWHCRSRAMGRSLETSPTLWLMCASSTTLRVLMIWNTCMSRSSS